ncbi:2-amino-4-hydroxy-6-hydroxymethyldihydropteridine diphosphokinase [Halobacillus sp. A1]|uniref:2-amino-4-hydroxy-6- hydroxymethyldihydropteridine diphosphokinase n=1 Tax=Halobacillus sp. A1 TaxID=2880262 RepID=UPI0020A69DB3|nr:2-amino-4-hydroxy-6-hydroxymethyldihydropteridine diphosphokinase [Halobacillus sp. A1]MCP3032143.1 2-amino-4-hydroxy-6-hydroxymethyldihydropteridine diphosphokinase [Halobacillus sp. A1]
MTKVYIALGSNLDERHQYLADAIEELKQHKEIIITLQSEIYETAPVGYTDQNDFLNMVVEAETELSPLDLLDYCQGIERELGRKRVVKWGPRTIDLDILLYNQENIKDERLSIPHPHMHERAFVMVPLAELNPAVHITSVNQQAQEIVARMPKDELKKVRIWKRD